MYHIHVEAPPLSLSITLVTYSNSKWVEPLKVVVNTGLCTHKMCHLFERDNTVVPALQRVLRFKTAK